jgi:hypothetical protein
LRIYAQDEGYDYTGSATSPGYYSNGQYYAVSCADYPQLFNMRTSSQQRRREFAAHVRQHPAHAFAPFTVKEWVRVNPFTEPYHACTAWPRRVHRADPPVVPHMSMDATHVPVLILNGEIDSLTPAAGGEHIHRQIGADSRHIVTANTVHLVAVDNPRPCGEHIVRRYLSDPSTLFTMKASCATKVRTVHTIGTFPRTVRQAQPMHGQGPRALRQLGAVALATAGDAAVRYSYVNGNRDRGLRGGIVRYRPAQHGTHTADFKTVRWTTDSTVSGRVTFGPNGWTGHGKVRVARTGASPLSCGLSWSGGKAAVTCDGRAAWHAPAP